MKPQHFLVAGVLATGLLAAGIAPLTAQVPLGEPQTIEDMEWNVRNLRPSNMPIIPIFDGWIPREDGTADLCYGYISLNLVETRDIPHGPDNFMTPDRYQGLQPTHFREVPPGYRRYHCVFGVNVPMGSEPVFWTMRHRGRTFSSPAHTESEEYILDNVYQPSRDAIAPVVRFLEPATSTPLLGRGAVTWSVGPMRTTVGTPVDIRIATEMPPGEEYAGVEQKLFRILWGKYSGPGDVTFSAHDTTQEEGVNESSTQATFSAPGNYRLILQAYNGNFGMQCCWTTGYVDVIVQ